MKFLRILFILLIATFVFIQFFSIDKNNPSSPVEKDLLQMENPNPEIAQMLRSSCYDCHSNETVWPWYSNLAPVSWMLKDHVDEGRSKLNFSNWGDLSRKDRIFTIEKIMEEIEDGEMPIKGYVMIHKDAKMSDEQQAQLFAWLESVQSKK